MRRPSDFTLLGWILVALMLLFMATVVVPQAKAQTASARLILKIESEKLRIFEYETRWLRCHVSIIDVRMIGSQAAITCVRKDERRHETPTRQPD